MKKILIIFISTCSIIGCDVGTDDKVEGYFASAQVYIYATHFSSGDSYGVQVEFYPTDGELCPVIAAQDILNINGISALPAIDKGGEYEKGWCRPALVNVPLDEFPTSVVIEFNNTHVSYENLVESDIWLVDPANTAFEEGNSFEIEWLASDDLHPSLDIWDVETGTEEP
ncbi:MAG: hypothetical protein JXX29_19710 [Deltaproteobacteria bacterium]|nr:hypothetical protein [Deltaproteobacteria bacterium]MBN2673917.1 hypothetical protein [Deltaproteobacteria bacterium]